MSASVTRSRKAARSSLSAAAAFYYTWARRRRWVADCNQGAAKGCWFADAVNLRSFCVCMCALAAACSATFNTKSNWLAESDSHANLSLQLPFSFAGAALQCAELVFASPQLRCSNFRRSLPAELSGGKAEGEGGIATEMSSYPSRMVSCGPALQINARAAARRTRPAAWVHCSDKIFWVDPCEQLAPPKRTLRSFKRVRAPIYIRTLPRPKALPNGTALWLLTSWEGLRDISSKSWWRLMITIWSLASLKKCFPCIIKLVYNFFDSMWWHTVSLYFILIWIFELIHWVCFRITSHLLNRILICIYMFMDVALYEAE